MKDNIFITGATGFFGPRLIKEILAGTRAHLFLLVRPKDSISAKERVEAALKEVMGGGKVSRAFKRITVIEGDVAKKNLGIKKPQLDGLIKKIDTILHCAAILDFYMPLEAIRKVNVEGTKNLLDFAYSCSEKGRLRKVGHISTAYVVGTRGLNDMVFFENQLDISQGFNNAYEQSKYEAELVVEEFRKSGLAIDIYRPSIMTETMPVKDQKIFSLFFKPFRFMISGIFKEVPASDDSSYNLVSAEDAARAILIISQTNNSRNLNYHIVNPFQIYFGQLLDIAVKVFGIDRPKRIPLKSFNMDRLTDVQKRLIGPYVPYFNFKARFDDTNAQRLLQKKSFRYHHLKDADIRSVFEYISENVLSRKP